MYLLDKFSLWELLYSPGCPVFNTLFLDMQSVVCDHPCSPGSPEFCHHGNVLLCTCISGKFQLQDFFLTILIMVIRTCFHSYFFVFSLELRTEFRALQMLAKSLTAHPQYVFVCLLMLQPYPGPCKHWVCAVPLGPSPMVRFRSQCSCVWTRLSHWIPLNNTFMKMIFYLFFLRPISTGEAMTMGWGGSSDANALALQVWLQYPAPF